MKIIFVRAVAVLMTIVLGALLSHRVDADSAAMLSQPLPRQMIALSGEGWHFHGGRNSDTLPAPGSPDFETISWADISVPHVFQSRTDLSIDQGWYERTIDLTPDLAKKHLYVVFEGAASVADVYVNGVLLGEHRGAYTRFIFDATSALHPGAGNILAVKVDNRHQSTTDCLPCVSGLYTIWGGLYRRVWLLATNDRQIDPTYYASPGVFLTPSKVSKSAASLHLKVLLRNGSSSSWPAAVTATILSPDGDIFDTVTGHASVDPNGTADVEMDTVLKRPQLWSPENPYLYHVRVDTYNGDDITDSVVQPLGFHRLDWDFKAGLLKLNGKPYHLYGCDLHQETEDKLTAVEPEDLIANIDALKDLGANWVRFSHYPRAQIEYDQCDEKGIFCWSENGHSHNDLASPTADLITTEMVEQNYNHPSIIVWSVGNEGNAAPAEREVPVVKALDPTRAVMVANMPCKNADYRAKNTYPGWYGSWKFNLSGFISEIGSGGTVTTHTDYAAASHKVDSFEPEEWQQLVAEAEFQIAFRTNRNNIGMFTWWVLRDFNDTKYKSKLAPDRHGINSKGLETYAGFKKDVYYLYKCFLRPKTPTVHITSKLYYLRQGAVDNGIKVYSNASKLTLYVNNQKISTIPNGAYIQSNPLIPITTSKIDNVFYWPVKLNTGRNTVVADDGKGDIDKATIYFYGPGGLPQLPAGPLPITGLTSTNSSNPAYFMDMPALEQWPVYYDFDSTADNSLDLLPSQVSGANWIALRRVTKIGQATEISFSAAQPITVYAICTKGSEPDAALVGDSFTPVATDPFMWRGNDLILVPAELYEKRLDTGQKVDLSLGDRDTLILIKKD